LRRADVGYGVATPSASQARQRSRGGDPFGLASEAALQGWRPHRPRKRGNAPRVATPSGSQARQRSTGGDPFGLASEAALRGWRPLRPRKRGSAPGVATPSGSQARQRSTGGYPSSAVGLFIRVYSRSVWRKQWRRPCGRILWSHA
jgi:hypothetical protein